MISNGSLITEEAARGMIEAGLDAINISVDASGKEVFETTRVGLKYDKVIANIERLVRLRSEAGKVAAEADPVVRAPEQLRRRAGVHRALAHASPTRSTSPTCTTGPGTLNQRSDVHYPCYRPWLTFTALWDGRVSLCCADFDGTHDPRRPPDAHDQGDLELGPLPRRPAAAPRERRPRHLPVLRPAEEGLAALGDKLL